MEHRSKPVISRARFARRLLNYASVALLLVIFSLFIGTIGYKFLGNLNWIDAFYNASMILTGMGPVNTLQGNTAKLFASFYSIYSGVAFLSAVGVVFTPILHRIFHILHVED